MSRKSHIRWRKSDSEELERVIRNFNAKLYRLKKKFPEYVDYLPNKLTYDAERKKILSRKHFESHLKELERFNKKKITENEFIKTKKGGKTTQWEIDEYERKEKIKLRRKKKKYDEVMEKPVTVGGEDTGAKRKEMGRIKDNELKPHKHDLMNKTQSELDRLFRNIDRQIDMSAEREKQQRMVDNYLKGLRDNGFLNANPDLEKLIRSLDFDTFYEFTQNDETATFTFYKDPLAFEIRLEYIEHAWKTAYYTMMFKAEKFSDGSETK